MAVAAVPALLLVAACGPQPGSGSPPPAQVGNLDADAVVLRVEQAGGFVPAETIAGRLPMVSIYGDGRVISEGPVPAIYPGPALPNLEITRIPADKVQALVQSALDAGVGKELDLGTPTVADAPETRFIVRTESGSEELAVYALGMEGEAGGSLTAEQKAARDRLSELMAELTGVASGSVSQTLPYEAETIAAIASPYAAQPDLPQSPVAWPGPQLPGEQLGQLAQLGCVTVSGEQAAKVRSAAADANALTPWTSGGKQWSVQIRPLLPDESGCADLAD